MTYSVGMTTQRAQACSATITSFEVAVVEPIEVASTDANTDADATTTETLDTTVDATDADSADTTDTDAGRLL